eukprot:4874275-Alexandrium_andersonii.AAC.1
MAAATTWGSPPALVSPGGRTGAGSSLSTSMNSSGSMSLMSGVTSSAWYVDGMTATLSGPCNCILEAVVGLVFTGGWGRGAET